jgi:hypothetical protein
MIRATIFLWIIMGIWIARVRLEKILLDSEYVRVTANLTRMSRAYSETINNAKQIEENDNAMSGLDLLASSRFLWTGPLNAMQYCMVSNIEVLRLTMHLNTVANKTNNPAADAKGLKASPSQQPTTREIKSIIIQAKDSGNPPMVEKFIEAITSHTYFQQHLRKDKPILMLERLPKQVDPTNPKKEFVIFTLECYFQDRDY